MTRGLFISFEGGEGAGKSTQIDILADRLEDAGHMVFKTREPGGSPGAERIREVMLSGTVDAWDARTELLLATAARRDHVEKAIRPALQAGKIVLCDRFVHSTLAYQAGRDGVTDDMVRTMHSQMIGDIWPDMTLILDLDPTVALARAARRDGDDTGRFEQMDISFHTALRVKFTGLADTDGACQLLNANQSVARIADQVWALAAARLAQ